MEMGEVREGTKGLSFFFLGLQEKQTDKERIKLPLEIYAFQV